MRKVVFLGDTLAAGQAVGVQRFAREILNRMDQMNLPFDAEVLVPRSAKACLVFQNIRVVQYGGIDNAFVWRQICFPEYVKKRHAIAVDLTLGLPILKCDVVCVHDCIRESFPEDFTTDQEKLKRRGYLLRVKKVLKRAEQIITVSQTSRNALMSCYHLPPERIAVISNGWQHFLQVQPDNGILPQLQLSTGNYFFSLGSRLKHKNFEWVVNAAKQNPQETFVVTGRTDLSRYQVMDGMLKNLIFTGYLTDSKIKALMQHCKAFVHPSLYEGFGIPPMEALGCGSPILISNASCLPEIYGNAARYFNPQKYDGIDMTELMQQPVGPPGPTLERYSWEKSAEKMCGVVARLC